MRMPLIIDEMGAIEFYPTKAEAERDMEPRDVIDGRFLVYDSLGERFEVKVVRVENPSKVARLFAPFVDVVKIDSESRPSNADPEELVRKLRSYFGDLTDKFPFRGDLMQASLGDLIGHAKHYLMKL
jgi:hypothetical protein